MGDSAKNRLAASAVALDDYAAAATTTGVVPVGGSATGAIETSGDADWFKVSLTAGQAYTFSLEGSRSGGGTLGSGGQLPTLALQSPNGTGSGTGIIVGASLSKAGDPLLSFNAATSGDYFVAVGGGVGTGTYTVRASVAVADDFSNSKLTTGAIGVGETLPGTLERVGDKDWFRIYLNKDTNYRFSFGTPSASGATLGTVNSDPTLTLYSQEGVALAGASRSTTTDASLWVTTWASGYYYLEVSDRVTGFGSYTLRATQGTGGPMYESVKTVPLASDIRVDSILSGRIDWNYLLPSRTTLYYTFNTSAMKDSVHTQLAAFNAEAEVAAVDILRHVTAVTGISFVETSSSDAADIHFGIDAQPLAASPTSISIVEKPVVDTVGGHVMTAYGADAFIYLNSNTPIDFRNNIGQGSAAYEALLREVGRALGLQTPSTSGEHAIPADQNNTDYTVMSGVRSGDYKSTFQANDLLALRWLYGGDGLLGSKGLNSVSGPSLEGPDITPPIVGAISPANGSTDAPVSGNIVFAFNEDIQPGSGQITLVNAADGSFVEGFAVGVSAALSWSGSLLIIDPTSDLVEGKTYQVQIPAGAVKDTAGNSYAGISSYSFTVAAPVTPVTPPVSYTVSGTMGDDVLVATAGDSYRGGAGSDTYIVSASTLSGKVTAAIVDTEGSNVVQLADGLVIASSSFYADAAQLSLSSGAVLQILGASKFSFQVGANAVAGDAAPGLSYAQFAAALGGSLPSGSAPAQGSANFAVPTMYDAAAAPTPAVASTAATVSGTLGADILVVSAGNSYLGGAGGDTYIVGKHTLAGAVTASITDTEGSNIIQLVDGTVISSSSFLADAVQLTLSTGAKVQVLGASKFSFQLGANAPGGDTSASLSYAQFGAALGATVPAAGGAVASGTADFMVPVSASGAGQAQQQSMSWPALSGVIDSAASDSAASIFSLP